MTLAEEFLRTASTLCKTDPLLLNEMGVVYYHQERLDDAVTMFRQALQVADESDCEPSAWLSTRINLGHALRRLGKLEDSLEEFDQVLRSGGRETGAGVFCAKGLVLMELNRGTEAVAVLHEALALSPQDAIATELLTRALDEVHIGAAPYGGLENGGGPDVAGEGINWDGLEAMLGERKKEAREMVRERGRRAAAAGGKGKGVERDRDRERRRAVTPREESLMDLSSDD